MIAEKHCEVISERFLAKHNNRDPRLLAGRVNSFFWAVRLPAKLTLQSDQRTGGEKSACDHGFSLANFPLMPDKQARGVPKVPIGRIKLFDHQCSSRDPTNGEEIRRKN